MAEDNQRMVSLFDTSFLTDLFIFLVIKMQCGQKRLIAIKISFCLHNICVFINYVFINTNTCMCIFQKTMYGYILNILMHN